MIPGRGRQPALSLQITPQPRRPPAVNRNQIQGPTASLPLRLSPFASSLNTGPYGFQLPSSFSLLSSSHTEAPRIALIVFCLRSVLSFPARILSASPFRFCKVSAAVFCSCCASVEWFFGARLWKPSSVSASGCRLLRVRARVGFVTRCGLARRPWW